MSNNDSDWLDDFIIMSRAEEEEKEEEDFSENESFPGSSAFSNGTSSHKSTPEGCGCSNVFILIAVIYILLKLLA